MEKIHLQIACSTEDFIYPEYTKISLNSTVKKKKIKVSKKALEVAWPRRVQGEW